MKFNRREPNHLHWKAPFTSKEKVSLWWGIGACFLVLGVMDWLTPPVPPFSGRWSWITSWAYNAVGVHGPAALHVAVAALLAVAGCIHWARHRASR